MVSTDSISNLTRTSFSKASDREKLTEIKGNFQDTCSEPFPRTCTLLCEIQVGATCMDIFQSDRLPETIHLHAGYNSLVSSFGGKDLIDFFDYWRPK